MALVSPEGVYLRIRKIDLIPADASAIRFVLYRDESTRRAEEPSPFDAVKEGDVRGLDVTASLFAYSAQQGQEAADALISAAYAHLKAQEQFEGWIDG